MGAALLYDPLEHIFALVAAEPFNSLAYVPLEKAEPDSIR